MSLPWKEIAGVARLPFLVLTPICVGAGAALSWWRSGAVDPGLLALVLIGALAGAFVGGCPASCWRPRTRRGC